MNSVEYCIHTATKKGEYKHKNPNINNNFFNLIYMNYVSKKVPRVLLAAMLLCFSIASFAQQIVVSGHVKDAYGEPIIGANAML